MNTDKFEWKATESAPKNYPMRIIEGTLIYRNDSRGLYIPSGGTISGGWGEMVSSHIVGPDLKPLPDKLDIKFFSYTEDQFYRGFFDLPYEQILSLFKEASKNEDGPMYDRIMTGVAPGGAVAVWLTGSSRTTEVFFDQADPVEGEIEIFGRVIPNHGEHVQKTLHRLVEPQVLDTVQRKGAPVDAWVNFRKRYHWKPVFIYGNEPSRGAQVKYLSGETDRLFFPLNEEDETRAVPISIRFRYRSPNGWDYLYIIQFDEPEIMEAFSTLGASQDPLRLEFFPHMPISQTQIRLRNEDESIVLKRYSIKEL